MHKKSKLIISFVFYVSNFLLLGVFSSLLTLSCATNLKKELADMPKGTYKEDVLDRLGSPHVRDRWHGMDRWVYQYDEETEKIQKEIHFNEGRAVYIGDHPKPAISAEEQDAINEKQNLELEKLYAQRREEIRKAFPKYEESIKGENEIRTVPHFEPIQ